jgi:preprotein translocase subunit SecF
MDLFANTNIDFMKWRKFWIVVSVAVMLLGVAGFFWHGKLNLGIEFIGGTQLTLGFQDPADPETLRQGLERAGIAAQVQRFGEPGSNQVLIKVAAGEGAAAEQTTPANAVLAVVRNLVGAVATAKTDLNEIGAATLTDLLVQHDPDGLLAQGPDAARAAYQKVAESVLAKRKTQGVFRSLDEVASVPGVSAAAATTLRSVAVTGKLAVLGNDAVSPQIGKEIRTRGTWAIVLALLGMLVYIALRFELPYGVGAVVASLHDVLVTLGLFILGGFEFNLTTIAAFLTLVGYSVNDTVVVFDRVRENLHKSRRDPLLAVMNRSVNQTLSRTMLTGGTTILASLALFLFGGDVLRGFAFIMTVGVVVGTYSSIYIASPFAELWIRFMENWQAKQKAGRKAGAAV